MSDTNTVQRISLEDLLDVCQKVRAAGGGNPLDALMPAIPESSSECLIAKNLNFNCSVCPGDDYTFDVDINPNDWIMAIDDIEVRDKIASDLGWTAVNEIYDNDEYPKLSPPTGGSVHALVLPPEIAKVANDFDSVGEFIQKFNLGDFQDETEVNEFLIEKNITLNDIREMLPYIEGAIDETNEIGIFNENGELIL